MFRIGRIAASLFIAAYLLLLVYGVGAHVLRFHHRDSFGMYFIVWDMFCGWDAFEFRKHLIGEGESGIFYDLNPPWKELQVFGATDRRHIDTWGLYSGRVAANTLRHSTHEPIIRVFAVEEVWSKKYNLPHHQWVQRFEEPKEKVSYYYLRSIYEPDGTVVHNQVPWPQHLADSDLRRDPVLLQEIARMQPHLPVVEPTPIQQVGYSTPASANSGGQR